MPSQALACIPLVIDTPERYARGDLMTQVAEHAAIIQVVRAENPRAVSATLRAELGNWLPPNAQSYELTVVRTLARVPLASAGSLRVTASPVARDIDQTHWQYGVQDRRENLRDDALTDPRLLPGPMSGGFEAPEHMTNCQNSLIIEAGDMFIALRDRRGSLYVAGARAETGQALRIDTLAASERGWIPVDNQVRGPPGLIRIRGFDDPLLIRLERAIDEARSEREGLDQSVWWEAVFLLVFGEHRLSR